MNKKKQCIRCVAFSLLAPFSCGIALPMINASESVRSSVLASEYSGYDLASEAEIMLSDYEYYINGGETVDFLNGVTMVYSKVNLNVRSSASTSGKVIGSLKPGESAVWVSTSGGWHKIYYGSGYGYVSASDAYSYVKSVSDGSKFVESLVNLNVRNAPNGSKVGLLAKGERAEYVETNGGWHTVIFGGKTAYVSASSAYTKIVEIEGSGGTPIPPQPEIPDTSKVVEINASGLNVRSAPTTSSSVLGVAVRGEKFDYIGYVNGWYQIEYKGKTAYVSVSYCILKDVESGGDGTVDKADSDTLVMACVDSLNVRSLPSTSSACVGSLDKGDMVSFVGLANGWYQTVYKGKTAYVSAGDVYSSLEYFEKGSDEVEEAIDFGYTLLGTPYVYGATRKLNYDGSENKYFTGRSYDCSSMVQYIYYETLGIKLGATSREQSLDGVAVAKGDIQRGDLLFFTNSDRYYNTGINRIGHVAIYLGDNYILHTASDHAVIEEISSTRWKYYITARRVI